MDDIRLIALLDRISAAAREFVLVSDSVLALEGSLQARDGVVTDEWQTCSLLSAFINFIGERERVRYGHWAHDLERKNNASKARDAMSVANRMSVCSIQLDDAPDELKALVGSFNENDRKLKALELNRPDAYSSEQDDDDERLEKKRSWMLSRRVMIEVEAKLIDRILQLEHVRDDAGYTEEQPADTTNKTDA